MEGVFAFMLDMDDDSEPSSWHNSLLSILPGWVVAVTLRRQHIQSSDEGLTVAVVHDMKQESSTGWMSWLPKVH